VSLFLPGNLHLTLPIQSFIILIQSTLLTAHTSGEVEVESDKLPDKIRLLYIKCVGVKDVSQSLIEFYHLSSFRCLSIAVFVSNYRLFTTLM
jgi:hypothetical protein